MTATPESPESPESPETVGNAFAAAMPKVMMALKQVLHALAQGAPPHMAVQLLSTAFDRDAFPDLKKLDPVTAWFWAESEDTETWNGPFKSRDEAASAGLRDCDDGCWTALCSAPRLRLSTFLPDEDDLLDRAEENLAEGLDILHEDDRGPWFPVTREQRQSLGHMIRAAVDAWQAMHDLTFTTRTFSTIREMTFHPPADSRQDL